MFIIIKFVLYQILCKIHSVGKEIHTVAQVPLGATLVIKAHTHELLQWWW